MSVHYWHKSARRIDIEKWSQGTLDRRFEKPVPTLRHKKLKDHYVTHSLTCTLCSMLSASAPHVSRKGVCVSGYRILRIMARASRLYYKFHPFVPNGRLARKLSANKRMRGMYAELQREADTKRGRISE